MIEPESQLSFRRGSTSARELQQVIDDVLAELSRPDTEAARAAQDAGLPVRDLMSAEVRVEEGEQGAEPILTTILVGIAVKAGSVVAERLWNDVLWPRIRRRLGADALGDQHPSATRSAGH